MIRFLADENFNARIIRGLRRRDIDINIRNALDAGLMAASDAEVLSWAAQNQFVILTHDVNTLVGTALERVKSGQVMTGVVVAGEQVTIGGAINDIVLIATCAEPNDLQGQIWYLPL